MRRYRNFGFPATRSTVRSTVKSASPAARSPVSVAVSKPVANPVVVATVKTIATNNKISDVQKQKEIQKVISKPSPIKEKPKKIIVPRPPSFRPAPSPPVVVVPSDPPRDSQGRPIAPGVDPGIVIDDPMEREKYEKEQELERQRKEAETRRKDEAARKAAEEADRQQEKPTPSPPSTPSPPAVVRPSPPRTSIRMPTAIPRTYSRNMRVSFRAPRLMLPKPTMRKLQPRPTKKKWNAMNPTYPSFMNRVKHGQFSFQNRGRISPQLTRGHSHAEIRKLQNQVNKLNADALKTRQDSMRERNALQSKLRDYELSPVTQLRDQAKGIFSVVDDASKFATPSVNGMHGFPSVGEGSSKALAVGFGLLTALFIIGRVE